MASEFFIKAFGHIQNSRVSVNGKEIYRYDGTDLNGFMKAAYRALKVDYPKYFKMDPLSKLAFMAADTVLKAANVAPESGEDIALVLSNRASSLDTDRRHCETMGEFPSPAIFVYTLPNICMGEISIRYNLHTENSFFIFERFSPKYLHDYTEVLLREGKANSVLCGWVDVDSDSYKAFVYLVGTEGPKTHDITTIQDLF